jgi:magnesium transporter
MNTDKAASCFMLLPAETTAAIIEKIDVSVAEAICRRLTEPYRSQLINLLPTELGELLIRKLEQIPNTVGILMMPAIAVNKDLEVAEILEIVDKNRENLESHLYVVDEHGILLGAVLLKDLIFAKKQLAINSLLQTNLPTLYPEMTISSTLGLTAWDDYRTIPVVDGSGKLLGTLPYGKTREVTLNKEGLSTEEILQTSSALGELYQIGLASFLQSISK